MLIKFSVITVCYKAVSTIAATMLSVLSQTWQDMEYVIVDGGSKDGTIEEIQKIINAEIQKEKDSEKHRGIRWISEPDKGIYDAMNKGIRMARGDYLLFMNAGDTFYNDKVLENIAAEITSISESTSTSSPALVYGTYATVCDGVVSAVIPARSYKKIWYGMFASHQSMFYNREFLIEHNFLYDTSYKIAADYKLTSQVVKLSKNILQTDVCVSLFDLSGISNQNQSLGLDEADRVRKELGYNVIARKSIVLLQLFARFMRNEMKGIYSKLRTK